MFSSFEFKYLIVNVEFVLSIYQILQQNIWKYR